MSHFTVMVIGDEPELQLEPYDENIEVEPYVRSLVSEKEKIGFVEWATKTYPEYKGMSYDELYPLVGKDWDGGHNKKNEKGEWEEWSTYNPKSKWDWYQLGGRWSGLIKLKEGAEGMTGSSGVFGNETGIDAALKGDIANLDELRTFAVVKNGEWYERGEMGWWACVSNEKSEEKWDKEIKSLLEGLPDDTLISIFDCHI